MLLVGVSGHFLGDRTIFDAFHDESTDGSIHLLQFLVGISVGFGPWSESGRID